MNVHIVSGLKDSSQKKTTYLYSAFMNSDIELYSSKVDSVSFPLVFMGIGINTFRVLRREKDGADIHKYHIN